MSEECPDLLDDVDACFWCPNCRLRHEDCMCNFNDQEGYEVECDTETQESQS